MDRTLPPGCSGAWVTPLAQGVGHARDSSQRRPYVFCVKAVSHTHTHRPATLQEDNRLGYHCISCQVRSLVRFLHLACSLCLHLALGKLHDSSRPVVLLQVQGDRASRTAPWPLEGGERILHDPAMLRAQGEDPQALQLPWRGGGYVSPGIPGGVAVGTAPKRDSQGPETHKDHPFLDGSRTALSEGNLCMNAHISSEVQLHLATQALLKDQLLELERRSVVSDSLRTHGL